MSIKKFQLLKRFLHRLPLALFIAAALFSCYTAYCFAGHITDSDVASNLVMGKFLADQSKIVSRDWFYSTELILFNFNLVYVPLFKIFGSYFLVRFLSSLLMQAMMVGSYYYLNRQIRMRRGVFFLTAALMLLPTSLQYGRYILYHNYYTFTFLYNYLIVGLFLSFVHHQGQKRAGQTLRLCGMAALTMASCLNGMRQFPATMLPLFVTVLIIALKDRRGAAWAPESVTKAKRTQVWAAGMLCAVGFAGLYIHNRFLSQRFFFLLHDGCDVFLSSADSMQQMVCGYLRLFGFSDNLPLFSVGGLLSLGGAAAAVVMLVISLGDIVPRERKADPAAAILQTLYPVAMLVITVLFLFTSVDEESYNFYVYIYPSLRGCFPTSRLRSAGRMAHRFPGRRSSGRQYGPYVCFWR